MTTEARRFVVSGRVQGVWFRDSTRREAQSLGITGYAVNLQSGEVEVLACGESGALDALRDWLRQGPPMAKVDAVAETRVDYRTLPGFTIG